MANSLCSLHFVRRLPFYLRQVSYGRRQSFFGHWRSSLFLRRCSSCGRCCGVWFRLQLLLEVLSVVVPSCSKVLQSWLWSAVLVGFGIVRCVVVLVVLGIFCILVIGVGVGWVSEGGCRFPLLWGSLIWCCPCHRICLSPISYAGSWGVSHLCSSRS